MHCIALHCIAGGHCIALHCIALLRQAVRPVGGGLTVQSADFDNKFGNLCISVCRKCGISVRSRVCAGQIIPAFSAVKRMRKLHYLVGLPDRLRWPVAS